MRCSVALFTVALATANAWGAIEYRGAMPTDISALYNEAKSKSGAVSRLEEGYIRITMPSEYTTYYFTTEAHPCHPAVVIQKIYEKDGALLIEAEGLTSGDRAKFEQWLRGFELQHEKIRRSIRAGTPGS